MTRLPPTPQLTLNAISITSPPSLIKIAVFEPFSFLLITVQTSGVFRGASTPSPPCSPLISALPFTGRALSFRAATRAVTVLSIPFFTAIGLAPAVTFSRPSLINSRARTDAVVVPSPALSLVLEATCLDG